MSQLLAVDLGLRTGLALFAADGRLSWYRSRHFGKPNQLRRRVFGMLEELPNVCCVVIEGGGPLATIWEREAARREVRVVRIAAELWREKLLLSRQQRSGKQSKQSANELARRVIDWSQATRPTSLRHDAAEAILVGLWGVLELGWLEELPPALRN